MVAFLKAVWEVRFCDEGVEMFDQKNMLLRKRISKLLFSVFVCKKYVCVLKRCIAQFLVFFHEFHHTLTTVSVCVCVCVCVREREQVCISGCECLKHRSYQSCLSSRNQKWTNGECFVCWDEHMGKSSISSEIRETVHPRSNTLLADTLTKTVMLLHPNESVLAFGFSLTSA